MPMLSGHYIPETEAEARRRNWLPPDQAGPGDGRGPRGGGGGHRIRRDPARLDEGDLCDAYIDEGRAVATYCDVNHFPGNVYVEP
jgi:hypothetical protein